jgi:hypothetical protein
MPFTLHFDSQENEELFDPNILAELATYPASIQINKIVFDTHFNQPITRLPSFIKHVEFGYYFKQNIGEIGDHIESLYFNVIDFNYDLATFPKDLKTLKIAGDKISSRIENLPTGLENLVIQVFNFDDDLDLASSNLESLKIISNYFNCPLDKLPASLHYLEIISSRFNQQLNTLPSGLELLKIDSCIFNQKLDNLPHGLKQLLLDDCELFTQPIDNLPHGLNMLNLHLGNQIQHGNEYKHTLTHLPSGIRKLRLANYWGDLNEIPNVVEDLDIWFPLIKSPMIRTHIQHWRRFPTGLKTLDFHRQMARLNKVHDMTDILKANIDCRGVCINGLVIE